MTDKLAPSLPPPQERIQRAGRHLLDTLNRNSTWPCACCGQVSGHLLNSACGALAHELAIASQLSAAPSLPPQRQYWSVTVSRNGESLVTIETSCLSGKPEFSEAEAETIRNAARHLFSFIGKYDDSQF